MPDDASTAGNQFGNGQPKMCGIAGLLCFSGIPGSGEVVTAMANAISHRGPDDGGMWADQDAGIALAHRRLSIVDLSAAGHQPMLSVSGRYVLSYNGEVYNHLDLRRELEAAHKAPDWRGHSDSETLVACIEAWGVETTLKRCIGMFAFALWDRNNRSLVLARDRAGEKPIFFGWQGDVFLFGSELKALRAYPAFSAIVDRGALALLLRHNYIPSPYSIYQGIWKLPPGTWLQLRPGQRDDVRPQAFWSLGEVAERGTAEPFNGSDEEAVDELARLLGKAVAGQQVSDVPLGALLSGGIDSSLVTALMQAKSSQPIRTFTIGFNEKAYDEAAHARAIAEYLGTEHTELRLSLNDSLDLVVKLPEIYDEPFADSSPLPTCMVMKLARQEVTVALSGDAGDEFFGGYNRYLFLPKVSRTLGRLPGFIRTPALMGASLMPGLVGKVTGAGQAGDKLAKLNRLFESSPRCIDDLYRAAVSEWRDPAAVVINGHIPPNLLDDRERWPKLHDPIARMMALDGMTYLPDDILTKVDRASMAASLETRAPFLDHDVMEFAWRLPMHMKLRDGRGKWILRQLLDRYVPRALIERPKMGFGIPLDQWLRGPLRDWAESLLAEDRLAREGYFDPVPIRSAWQRHQRGEASLGYRLWSVLMFQAWLERQESQS